MGLKNQNTMQLGWLTSTPVPFVPNTALSSVVAGVMTSTNTIYTNIIDVTIKDNLGLQLEWTGTPTGTVTIQASSNGTTFHTITFSPTLTQPTGTAGGYLVDLTMFPWKYIFIQYVNSSGAGILSAWMTTKDLN